MTLAIHATAKRGIAIVALTCIAAPLQAATMTFDFNTGFGPLFQTTSTDNLFTVDNAAGSVHIFKGIDNPALRPNPNEFISGGVNSLFTLGGDFSATVDFSLATFAPAGGEKLNESVLSVASPTESALVLRFTHNVGQFVEGFKGVPLGAASESATTGKYRLERTGSFLAGSYDDGGGFTTLFSSIPIGTDPFGVTLLAVQGANIGERSGTALDISFDNLVVVADSINIAAVPEPSTYALMLAGLGLVGYAASRRRKALPAVA